MLRRVMAISRVLCMSIAASLGIPTLYLAPGGPTGARPAAASTARVARSPFGTLSDGSAVELFTLTNANGIEVRAMTYGGIIVSLRTPDRAGRLDDIVLGYDRLDEYVKNNSPYFGAIIGRYGNRIAKGRFVLDGHAYELATNDGPNHLHGGVNGFNKQVWRGEPFEDGRGVGVTFTRPSPDGEEGYPGRLDVRVTYTLTARNELAIDYEATTDRPTIVNLTQHSYWNLAGQGARDILDHRLRIDADRYTPVDATLIPTGALAPVEGTPFDFRTATAVGARIEQPNEQLTRAHGYDHNWILNRKGGAATVAAHVADPSTGRMLDVATTEPGLQFYTGNFLDGTITGKAGRVYRRRYGLCLETQHFPDSPNHSNFPSTVLRPGERYTSRTIFTFGVEK